MGSENQERTLRVVLASPGDVQEERELLDGVIDEVNDGIAAERGRELELLRWEKDATPGPHERGAQGQIDEALRIEDCDILICIFWKRMGTPVGDAQSGTEHEFRLAYSSWQRRKRPHIMLYFKSKAFTLDTQEEIDQYNKLFNFKNEFSGAVLSMQYEEPSDFAGLVRRHLTSHVQDLPPVNIQPAEPPPPDELIKSYRAHLAQQVSEMLTFRETEHRPLEEVFVRVNILRDHEQSMHQEEWLGLMDMKLRQRRDVFAAGGGDEPPWPSAEGDHERRPQLLKPDELLTEKMHALIAGAPGCGKTTLIKYLTLKTINGGERFPVFFELKNVHRRLLDEAQGSLPELLFRHAVAPLVNFETGEAREDFERHFMKIIKDGKVSVFLDGVDEVRGEEFFNDLCKSINAFAPVWSDNIVIVTTRPYAVERRFSNLWPMEIAPLDPPQVQLFLDRYYSGHPLAKELPRHLNRHREIDELARVPLMLGFIAELYRRQGRPVGARLELYRQIVVHLVNERDNEKNLTRFRVTDPDGMFKREFLKRLAYERLFVDSVGEGRDLERLVFREDEILRKAQSFCLSKAASNINPGDLVRDVRDTQLLRKVGSDTYAFTHLTLLEYLAAEALSEREEFEEVFCRSLFNPILAAMEVLPMALGLAPNPDDFYAAMERLPESLSFDNVRLRARGLAYAKDLGEQYLTRLAARLFDFVSERHVEETPYTLGVLRSFLAADNKFMERIALHLKSLLSGRDDPAASQPPAATRGLNRLAEWLASSSSHNALVEQFEADYALVEGQALSAHAGERQSARQVAREALKRIEEARGAEARADQTTLDELQVRRVAGRVREKLGVASMEEAVGELIGFFEGEARRASNNILNKWTIDTLLEAILGEDKKTRGQAAEKLGLIQDPRATDALLAALQDTNPDVRIAVVRSLVRIGSRRVVEGLLAALTDEEFGIRRTAAEGLVKLRDEELTNGLGEALSHVNSFVRRKAAQFVGYYAESAEVLDRLSQLAQSDAVDEVREVARRAAEEYTTKLAYFRR